MKVAFANGHLKGKVLELPDDMRVFHSPVPIEVSVADYWASDCPVCLPDIEVEVYYFMPTFMFGRSFYVGFTGTTLMLEDAFDALASDTAKEAAA